MKSHCIDDRASCLCTRLDVMVVQLLEDHYPRTHSVNQSCMLHNLEYDISGICLLLKGISQTTSEIQGQVVREHLQRAKDLMVLLSVWYIICLLTC